MRLELPPLCFKCLSAFFLLFHFQFGTVCSELSAGISYAESSNKLVDLFVPLKRSKREAGSSLSVVDETQSEKGTDDDRIVLVNETALWNTSTQTDDHIYYLVTYHEPTETEFRKHWINVTDLLNKKEAVGAVKHPQLSNSYRRAASTNITFPFPFYGQNTFNITLATGGFCYVGDHMHSWLAATQYIAPLMANFDTSRKESNILYATTASVFIVEWRDVYLRHQHTLGAYTFQVQLHKSGDIWFLYEKVPSKVNDISDAHHPRKVGLSDAYLFFHHFPEHQHPWTKTKRVIYEYHRVEIDLEKIETNLVIEIKAKPTCISFGSCNACVNASLEHFTCHWCTLKGGQSFCSDDGGFNRRRQEWINGSCKEQKAAHYCTDEDNTKLSSDTDNTGSTLSSIVGSSESPQRVSSPPTAVKDESTENSYFVKKKKVGKSGVRIGSVLAVLFIFAVVVGVGGWVVYAYYNPHTQSGQFLIRIQFFIEDIRGKCRSFVSRPILRLVGRLRVKKV